MSWKDYFYFTASQRRALLVVCFLIIVLFFLQIPNSYFSANKKTTIQQDSVFLDQVARFKNSLQEFKPTYKYRNQYKRKSSDWHKSSSCILFPFNPNTLDSIGFIKLGLKPYLAKNILRYRSKGGKFRTVEAFSKVYGLSSEKFAALQPYIQIPSEEKPVHVKKELAAIGPISINDADTSQIKQFRGVGSGMAKRIIAYRNKLGGFASAAQLKEVWGLSPELAEQIIPFIKIDVAQIKKIPLNKSSIDKLRNHPYINFYRAKAIYEYRKDKGKISSLEECKKIDDESLSPDFWIKIAPYLEF